MTRTLPAHWRLIGGVLLSLSLIAILYGAGWSPEPAVLVAAWPAVLAALWDRDATS